MMTEPNPPVREAALRMLARRAYGAEELRGKLFEKGFSEDQAADAVGWLLELRYLDDGAYAENLARSCAARGYGPYRIRQELRRRCLDEALIEETMEAAPPVEDGVDAALARLARGSMDAKERRRVAAVLYRKGFSWDDIRAGFSRMENEDGEEPV